MATPFSSLLPPTTVTDPVVFAKVCASARDVSAANLVVTFGVRPTRAATEYGYICGDAAVGPDVFAIEKFVENPDSQTAQQYVADGYLWNSGNFMFRAEFLLDEYRRFEPESSAAVTEAVNSAGSDLGFVTLEPRAFARAAAKSIDYAVIERTTHAVVVPVSYGWSDVGSWQSVGELSARDAANNAANGRWRTMTPFLSRGAKMATACGAWSVRSRRSCGASRRST